MRPIFLLFLVSGCSKLFVSDQDVLSLYDQDGDGYYAEQATAVGETGPFDCDDGDGDVHPGGTDVCNGLDDDCDGTPDDGDDRVTYYEDADGDGYGDEGRLACSAPAGFVAVSGDCDDGNDTIHPGATDLCNGADEDCDGTADDGPDRLTWYLDRDGDGYGSDERLACTQPTGFIAKGGDCDDDDADAHPGGTEVCGGGDEDCDGKVDAADESLADGTTYYADADADGTGDAETSEVACSQPSGFVDDATDCDDDDGAVHVGATEVCDGIDDDCDGQTDDADSGVTGRPTWYHDADKDGYGDAATSTIACDQPSGYVADATNCHDTDGKSYPGAAEWCGTYDYDCDGLTEEATSVDAIMVYDDADGDGYGDAATGVMGCLYGTLVANADDCDDTSAVHHPGATEYCLDATDDDCDGSGGVCQFDTSTTVDDGIAAHFAAAMGAYYGSDEYDRLVAFGHYTSGYQLLSVVTSSSAGLIQGVPDPDLYLATGSSTSYSTTFAWLTGTAPYPTPLLRTLTSPTIANMVVPGSDDLLIIGAPFAGETSNEGVVYITEGGIDLASCTRQFVGPHNAGVAVDNWQPFPPYTADSFVASDGAGVVYFAYSYSTSTSPQSLTDFGTITGSDPFGQALAARSDIDADGAGEIVVTSPGKTGQGAVYGFNGFIMGTFLASDADFIVTSSASSTNFAWRLDTNEDLDGDGYDDLLVGAPDDNVGGKLSSGAVYLFHGPVSSGTEATADLTIEGVSLKQHVGADVAAVDLDGDGLADVLAGANEGTDGAVYGFSGLTTGTISVTGYDYKFSGATDGAYHVMSAGDLDADGWDDFAVWGNHGVYVMTHEQL